MKNPGGVLKGVAGFFCTIGIIAAIILASQLGKLNAGLAFFYFLIITFGVCLVTLILYCFGEITERVKSIDIKLSSKQNGQVETEDGAINPQEDVK